MAREWYYAIEDRQQGPVDAADLGRLGALHPQMRVWRDGLPVWQTYTQMKRGCFSPKAPQASSLRDIMADVQETQSGSVIYISAPENSLPPLPWWRRWIAFFVRKPANAG